MGGGNPPLTKFHLGLGTIFTICIYISDILIMCSKQNQSATTAWRFDQYPVIYQRVWYDSYTCLWTILFIIGPTVKRSMNCGGHFRTENSNILKPNLSTKQRQTDLIHSSDSIICKVIRAPTNYNEVKCIKDKHWWVTSDIHNNTSLH